MLKPLKLSFRPAVFHVTPPPHPMLVRLQPLQGHRGAPAEAPVVRELCGDGQGRGGRRPQRTAEDHPRPPPQDLVQLAGQHQVSPGLHEAPRNEERYIGYRAE